MVDLKLIIASNIIKLRTEAGMTQSELGEKLNYSDKSISKWERAESLPDANVLKQMSEIFGVSIDYLFSTHDGWEPKKDTDSKAKEDKEKIRFNLKAVEGIALCGILTFALFLFILFWIIMDSPVWMIFFAAIPVALLTHLVLNSVWNKGRRNRIIITLFVLSVLLFIYMALIKFNIWQIFLLMIPVVIILYLSSKIKEKDKEKSENDKK